MFILGLWFTGTLNSQGRQKQKKLLVVACFSQHKLASVPTYTRQKKYRQSLHTEPAHRASQLRVRTGAEANGVSWTGKLGINYLTDLTLETWQIESRSS